MGRTQILGPIRLLHLHIFYVDNIVFHVVDDNGIAPYVDRVSSILQLMGSYVIINIYSFILIMPAVLRDER